MAQHVITVYIFKDWKQYSSLKERIAVLADHRGEIGYIQREDIEDAKNENMGMYIFSLFLSYSNSRLESIIRIKQHTEKNSSYQQVAQVESQFKDQRLTRQLGKPIPLLCGGASLSIQALVACPVPLSRKIIRRGVKEA